MVIRADQNERDAWEWVINLPRVTALPLPPRATSSCRVTPGDTACDTAESTLTPVTQAPASGKRPRGRRDRQKLPSKAPAPDCSAPPSFAVGSTVLVELSGRWRCVKRDGVKTVAQLLEDEWGMPREKCVVTVDGRQISLDATLASFPLGVPLRVSHRLRGGAPACAKKLRELLLSKGVPEEEVATRMSEVASAIGDQVILEAFNSFDSWQALKARCHGKLRLVKQSEQRPAKPKPASPEEDALQMNDPWAEALLHRKLTPDTAFFQTADGTPPALLQKVSHGCTGVAIVDTKEAQILAKAEDDLSPDALSVIALGEADLPEARCPHRVIELPCRDHTGRQDVD